MGVMKKLAVEKMLSGQSSSEKLEAWWDSRLRGRPSKRKFPLRKSVRTQEKSDDRTDAESERAAQGKLF